MKSVIINLSEIELAKRWDFGYHDPAYTTTMRSLDQCYPAVRFGEIITLLTDMGAFSLYKTEFFVNHGVPFLRVQNIQEYGVDLTKETKYISQEYHQELKKSQLYADDLLLTTKAIIGVAAVVGPDLGDCNISQNLVRIRLKKEVNPKYIAVFLNSRLGRIQTETASTGSNQKYLNFQRIQNLKITLPPPLIQAKITQRMEEAYMISRDKLCEVKKIENLTKNYIQNYFNNSSILNNTLKVNYYTRAIKDLIQSNRFDCDYFSPQYLALETFLNSLDNVKKLGEIASIDYGFMPTEDYVTQEEGIPLIRVTNILSNTGIDMSNIKFVRATSETISEKLVQENDILMVQCGNTTGKVAIVPKELNGYAFASFCFRIRLKTDLVLPRYLLAILHSNIGFKQILRSMTYATVRPNTTKPYIKSLQIPILSKSIQEEIAQILDNYYLQIKCLYKESEKIITEAKARVERMILGEEDVT